jgi:hypothetical protein
VVAVAAAVACAGGPTPPVGEPDPARSRLLGALPPAEAARGVYVVDLAASGDFNPGSRLAPIVAGLAADAELLVETAAPPVTLLAGVGDDVTVPAEAARVDDVVVLAEPAVRDEVVARLRDGARPEGLLAGLAVAGPPVGWAGPTPSPSGLGTTVIELRPDAITFRVSDVPLAAAAEHAQRELTEGAPPGSPGKPWRDVLGDAVVERDAGTLLITAVPLDLPGLFLRALIDGRQLTFLPGA